MNKETLSSSTAQEVQKAINSACRMLALREHSQKQLREKLRKKAYADKAISEAINYLISENWLSDERFCSSFIRSKAAKGQGDLRIEMELQQHGLTAEQIGQGFEEQDIDWRALCLEAAQKKIRMMDCFKFDQSAHHSDEFEPQNHLSYQQWTQQKLKLERFLRYRGFALDVIKTTIKKCLKSRSPI